MEKEIYLSVKNYEGYYEVSNLGNIRSVDRMIADGGRDLERKLNGKKLSFSKGSYYTVSLSKNKIKKRYLVHRLVCEAFLPKIENKNIVNHKDSNTYNNNVENLEWCTTKENCLHSREKGRSVAYWTGKKRSDEDKQKMSLAKKGKPSKKRGTKLTQEIKQKISNTLKGNIPWNKGLKLKNKIK
jgi:hypothetical protein